MRVRLPFAIGFLNTLVDRLDELLGDAHDLLSNEKIQNLARILSVSREAL